jgi:hypothetical protein
MQLRPRYQFEVDKDEYDTQVGGHIRNATISFVVAALFGGYAAGEATDSIKVGAATGLALSALGFSTREVSSGNHMSRVRATIVDSGIVTLAADEATKKIIETIQELNPPGPPPTET